jgi:hypothetical protein
VQDIEKARQYFAAIDLRFHYLLTLLAVPLRRTSLFGPVLRFLEILDRIVLSVPGLQRMAWQSTFELSGPKGK